MKLDRTDKLLLLLWLSWCCFVLMGCPAVHYRLWKTDVWLHEKTFVWSEFPKVASAARHCLTQQHGPELTEEILSVRLEIYPRGLPLPNKGEPVHADLYAGIYECASVLMWCEPTIRLAWTPNPLDSAFLHELTHRTLELSKEPSWREHSKPFLTALAELDACVTKVVWS